MSGPNNLKPDEHLLGIQPWSSGGALGKVSGIQYVVQKVDGTIERRYLYVHDFKTAELHLAWAVAVRVWGVMADHAGAAK